MNKKIVMLFVLPLIIVVSGCTLTSAKEEMLKDMEDKYGEKFEFVSADTQAWNAGYSEMILRSDKFPDYRIAVRKNKKSGVIGDNYLALLMKESIEKEFKKILNQVYDEFKVFYIPGGATLSTNDSSTMSILEFSNLNNIPLSIQIAVADPMDIDNRDELIEKLRVLLAEQKYKVKLSVFYMKEGMIKQLTDKNRGELFSGATKEAWIISRGDFLMGESFEFEFSSWRDLENNI